MEPLSASPGVECPQCGAELPGTAKFCLDCGTPMPAGRERETRRTVTLLFTDVTGSTAMGEQLDPEAYRSVMGRYFALARAAVERHGGQVEKFVGDAVLAVFGLPEVREDDALRAVRAAHELNEAVAELSTRLVAELGVRLQIRTGVNTGAVVTGSARAGGSFATGDAVNTAARLEQAAGPGEVLLGAATYELVRDAIEAEPAEPVQAKGKTHPLQAYRLLSLLDADRGRRRHEDAPLVGRERESRSLDDALERMLATGRSHLITVIGPAGIGKSRLLADFLTRVDDRAGVASGRCVSYGQGITYWPLVQALREALTLSGTESDEIVRHAVEQALGAASDAPEVADLLMPILGRTGTPGTTDSTIWAVRRLLEELASHRPLVLTIDDLHWGEPTLLDLVERVRDEVHDLPLLLVCQARPELLEQRPGWGSGALNTMTMTLDPLSADDIASALTALLGGDLPPELVRTVTDWSGGNPLFVEEIVAHLRESGGLRREQDGWVLDGTDHLTMPPTVSALLSARLDRLPAPERELLERVSVIGLEFSAREAEMLSDDENLPPLLTSLGRRDLLRRTRSAQGEMWGFKHLMVRDAAYESLAKTLRAELHEPSAEALQASEDGGLERESFVAHHLAQAAAYQRELGVRGPQAESLVERAVAALIDVAEAALAREEAEAAATLVERAYALRPVSSALRREILMRLARVHQHEADVDAEGESLVRLAAEQDETSTDLDAAALDCLVAGHRLNAGEDIDPEIVRERAKRLVRVAAREGVTWLQVIGLRAQVTADTMRGLWSRAAGTSEEIVRLGQPADVKAAEQGRAASAFYGPGSVAVAKQLMDDQARHSSNARQAHRAAVMSATVAAARRDPSAMDLVRVAEQQIEDFLSRGLRAHYTYLIDTYSLLHDLDRAIEHAAHCNDEFRDVGDHSHASTYILFQAALMLMRGDALESVVPLLDEAESYTSPYDALSVSFLAGCRAVVAARSGDPAAAVPLAEEGLRVVDATDQAWQQADLRRLVFEAFVAAGQVERGRQVIEEARALYHGKEITAYDEDLAALLAQVE